MNPAPLTIDVSGMDEAAWMLQALHSGLANRGRLHAEMAVNALQATQQYLRSDTDHTTAQRLGATPTGFRAKSAQRITAASDDDAAILRIPRNTGLGRAFADLVIAPTNGRTYLTIPGCAETYGRGVRDFPEDAFDFAILHAHRPFPVLLWAADGGGHRKGDVAYWLRRKVLQKQDRTLLPSDDTYREIGRRTCVAYISNLVYHS